jgi:hypothetical protein
MKAVQCKKLPIRNAKSFVFNSAVIATMRLSTLLGVPTKGPAIAGPNFLGRVPTQLGNGSKCGVKWCGEQPEQKYQHAGSNQRDAQEVRAQKGIENSEARNRDKEPGQAKIEPANRVLRNYLRKSAEPQVRVKTRQLQNIDERDAEEKCDGDRIAFSDSCFVTEPPVLGPERRSPDLSEWRRIFGKNASPREGEGNGRADHQRREQEKCETVIEK